MQQLREDNEIPSEYAVSFECVSATDVEVLHTVRKRLKSDAVVILGIRDSGTPLVMEKSIKGGSESKRCSAIVDKITTWDSDEYREMVNLGSRVGNANRISSALVKFPSKRFRKLPRTGIDDIVVTAFPERNDKEEGALQPMIVFVNGGHAECGDKTPSLKTQYEQVAFTLACEFWQMAEGRFKRCREVLETLNTKNVNIEHTLLWEEAISKSRTRALLGDNWTKDFVRTRLEGFSNVMEQFASGFGDVSEVEDAVSQLLTTAQWAQSNAVVLELLTSSRSKPELNSFVNVAQCLVEVCSTKDKRLPTSLDDLVAHLSKRFGEVEAEVSVLTAAALKDEFRKHFPGRFREQKHVTATVEEAGSRFVRLAVETPGNGSYFRVPIRAEVLSRKVVPGDRLDLEVWDLWGHWYGIADVKVHRRTSRSMKKYIRTTRNLKFDEHAKSK